MDPLVIRWQGRSLRVRHDDERITPYSPQASRIRSAVELASDVDGLRLVLGSVLDDHYRVRVAGDGSVLGLWRRKRPSSLLRCLVGGADDGSVVGL